MMNVEINKSNIIGNSNSLIEIIPKDYLNKFPRNNSQLELLIFSSYFSNLYIDDKFFFLDGNKFIFKKIYDMQIMKVKEFKCKYLSYFENEKEFDIWFKNIQKEENIVLDNKDFIIIHLFKNID